LAALKQSSVGMNVFYKRVRGEDGRDTAMVDAAVAPFRVAGVVVRGRTKLELGTARQAGDNRRMIGHGGPGVGRIAEVGSEGLDFGGRQRVAQAVANAGWPDSTVNEERPFAPFARGGVIDQPSAEVEAVGLRVDEGRVILEADGVAGVAGADVCWDPHHRHAGRQLGIPGDIEADLVVGTGLFQVREQPTVD
jgi:hypothetical protein